MRKDYRLQVLGYSLIFLLLFAVTCTLSTTYAADSTPSADLKDKLSELQREIASKAAQLKQQVNKNLQNKAYTGLVKTKSDNSLTLVSEGGAKIVSLNQDTEFDSNIRKITKYSLKTLKIDDFIAALGDVDENEVLTAQRIILSSPPQDSKIHLWGQVISIADELITLTTKEGKNITVGVTSRTDLEKDDKSVSLSTLIKNNFVIITGVMGKNEILSADFIYIYSQPAFLKPKKVATPSAETTKSATTSAKKKLL